MSYEANKNYWATRGGEAGYQAEVQRKAQNGIALSHPTQQSTQLYNQFQQQAQQPQQGFSTNINQPNNSNINMPSSLNDQKVSTLPWNGGGIGNNNQKSLQQTMNNTNFQQGFQYNTGRLNQAQQIQNPSYLQGLGGLGGQVNMGFSDWGNKDAVMEQLNASATALGQLSRNENIMFDDVQDLYRFYEKTHQQANQLGFEGAIAPGWKTGYTDGRDYVSALDRGFGQYATGDWNQPHQLVRSLSQSGQKLPSSVEERFMKYMSEGGGHQSQDQAINLSRMNNQQGIQHNNNAYQQALMRQLQMGMRG